MTDQPAVRRSPALSRPAQASDARQNDADLARNLMVAEYARMLVRRSGPAQDVQGAPITAHDARLARALGVVEYQRATGGAAPKSPPSAKSPPPPRSPAQAAQPPAPDGTATAAKRAHDLSNKVRAGQGASIAAPSPATTGRCKASNASQSRSPSVVVPKGASEARAALAISTPIMDSGAQRTEGPSHVQAPRRFTVDDRQLFTFATSRARTLRTDVMRAVALNFALVEVSGDGNCGFYSLLAGWVHHAAEFETGRASMVNRLRELGSAANDCTHHFGRVARELPYPNARRPQAMADGKRALRDLAEVIAARPHQAVAYMQKHPADFEKACYVLRATAARDHLRPEERLDPFARTDDDLAPLSLSCGITLVAPSTDPASSAWTPQAFQEVAQARRSPGTIYMLHSQNHFSLLLPLAPAR